MADLESTKRDRSPKFPYIGLGKALERVEVLYSKVKRYDARVADIAKDWGLSPKSSSTDRTVAAIQSFGLIEDSGAGETRKIKVSELGARIIADQRPGVRESLLAEAALKPPIIADYARRWEGGRPDESHALSQLQFEGGFTLDGAKMFLRVFDETIRFTSVRKGDKIADAEVGGDRETEDADSAEDEDERPDEQVAARTQRRKVKVGVKEDVYNFTDDSQLVIQYPVSLSAESFHELEDYVALFLRKMRRMVDAQAQSVFDKVDDALSAKDE